MTSSSWTAAAAVCAMVLVGWHESVSSFFSVRGAPPPLTRALASAKASAKLAEAPSARRRPGSRAGPGRARRVGGCTARHAAPREYRLALCQCCALPSRDRDKRFLVYYGAFEQALALSNIESLLRPGGLLLSNNAVIELPVSRLRSIGYSTTLYSTRPG